MLISISCSFSISVSAEMKLACDWKYSETGAGIAESNQTSFRSSILARCPYFDELEEIFTSRACAELARNFKNTVQSLVDCHMQAPRARLMAAYQCKDFKQFLEPREISSLAKLAAEYEEADCRATKNGWL